MDPTQKALNRVIRRLRVKRQRWEEEAKVPADSIHTPVPSRRVHQEDYCRRIMAGIDIAIETIQQVKREELDTPPEAP